MFIDEIDKEIGVLILQLIYIHKTISRCAVMWHNVIYEHATDVAGLGNGKNSSTTL